MKGEKFPQAEYAEFIGDGVYFDEKPPKPVSEDEKKKADEAVDARERSLGDMNDALLDDTQGKSKLPRTELNSVAPLEPMAPFVKKIPKIPEFQEQFPKEKKPEKKNELGDINDALMDHPAASTNPKKTDAISKEGVHADSNSSTPPAPKVRIGRESHDVGIQRRKEEYINDYTRNVKSFNGVERGWAKFKNWLGIQNKHNYGRNSKIDESQKEFNKRQDMSTADRLAEVGQTYKTRTRNERVGSDGKIIEREKAFERYQGIMKKIEARREETRLADMKKDREELNAERENAWPKSKVMAAMKEKLATLNQNKLFRNTIGNKYVRFGLMTGIIGTATGGLGSVLFYGTRAARFLGGAAAGGLARKGLDKWVQEEKILQKEIDTLDAQYQSKAITQSTYDGERLRVDMYMNRIKRGKEAAAIAAGLVGATGAGYGAHGIGNMIEEKIGTPLMPQGVAYENPPVSTEPTPVQDPEAILPPQYTYPDAMPVSSLGALDTIEKYKAQLAAFYVDKPIPPVAQHFMDTPTADLAKEIGAWDPNAVNESHTMPKGSTIGLKDGALLYHNSVTGANTEVLKTLGSRAGEVVVPTSNELDMFDSGKTVASPEATVADQPLTSEQSDTQLSGGRGAPNEDIRDIADKPAASQWFTVADENTVATPVSATPSLPEIETTPGATPEIPVEEQEALARKAEEAARKALYEEMMKEEAEVQNVPEASVTESNTTTGGIANAETLPLKEVEPQSIPLVDESELKVQDQTDVITSEPAVQEKVSSLSQSEQVVRLSNGPVTGTIAVELDPNGKYTFADSTWDLSPEGFDRMRADYAIPENLANDVAVQKIYLPNTTIDALATTEVAKSQLLTNIRNYHLYNVLLRYSGLDSQSPVYQAALNEAEKIQSSIVGKYGTGILRDITVPGPIR